MVFDKYFMVIPVYRLPKDKYFSQLNEDLESQISNAGCGEEINPKLFEKIRSHHRSSYGGEWEFNEIVGYIKLFFMGNQVRGEYWSTKPRRKVRTRKKVFQFKAHKLAPECSIVERTCAGSA